MPNNISQVVLDHHQKDMVLINWAMSTILIGYLIFFNIPGRLNEVWNIFCNHILNRLDRKDLTDLFIIRSLWELSWDNATCFGHFDTKRNRDACICLVEFLSCKLSSSVFTGIVMKFYHNFVNSRLIFFFLAKTSSF